MTREQHNEPLYLVGINTVAASRERSFRQMTSRTDMVCREINKDYSQLSARELLPLLQSELEAEAVR